MDRQGAREMNPTREAQLADLLARLIADGEITEEQAIALYMAVAGDDSLLDEMLPLPPYLGINRDAEADDDPPLLLLLLAGAAAGVAIGSLIDPLTQHMRVEFADILADMHATEAERLAARLVSGQMTTAEFQTALRTLNRTHTAGQTMLGAGSRAGQMRATLEELAESESAFLQRFADHIAGNRIAGTPLSEAQIANRASQYGARGRAMFFRAWEEQGSGSGAGWICKYTARHDGGTCMPCLNAEGYYLPGTGPYPGDICLGRESCRCRRVTEYNPTVYAQLTGGTPPTP
jgi:hypothetical protein